MDGGSRLVVPTQPENELLHRVLPVPGEAHEVDRLDTLESPVCFECPNVDPGKLPHYGRTGGRHMTHVHVEASFQVTAIDGLPQEALERHVLEVQDHLLELTDVFDQTVSAELSTGIVTIDVVAPGSTEGSAIDLALSCIRSAIHGAGGCTPDWPTINNQVLPDMEPQGPHGEWSQGETRFRPTDLISA